MRDAWGRAADRLGSLLRGVGLVATLAASLMVLAGPLAAQTEDPLESVNRDIFAFNDAIDRWVVRPVASGYDRVTPEPVQRGITNVFDNLGTPVVALNQLLQGKPKLALGDLTRFVVNSTVGVAGIFDVAGRNGLPRHDEDFGQTFAVWAGGQGPFVTLPFRGPSSVSHTAGMVLNAATSPILWLLSSNRDRLIVGAVDVVNTRAALLATDELVSGDRYLFLRDAYLQNREFLINDGVVEEDPFLDDFDDFDE